MSPENVAAARLLPYPDDTIAIRDYIDLVRLTVADALATWSEKFIAHTEAVEDFLREMVAVYDPCAEGAVSVKETCATLLSNAIAVRQASCDDEARILALQNALADLVNAKALAGVRDLVAGWNGEDRHDPPQRFGRHPDKLGADLPHTNCGAVYALDEAMVAARAVLAQQEKS